MSAWYAHEQRLHAAAQAFAEGRDYGAENEWAQRRREREADTPEAAALRLLGLQAPIEYPQIRARYIELVKQNHPDANGGDKDAEERLKTINQALQILKAAYLA
jgi:DnaJ-class molecular chaperone